MPAREPHVLSSTLPGLAAEQGTPSDAAQLQQEAGSAPPLPRPIQLPELQDMPEKEQLAEYFGVPWKLGDRSLESPSPHRNSSPASSHIRSSAVGGNSLADSPGPLQEFMEQSRAFGRPSDGLEDVVPDAYSGAPATWEELFSVQTRAMLELRVGGHILYLSKHHWWFSSNIPQPHSCINVNPLSHTCGYI